MSTELVLLAFAFEILVLLAQSLIFSLFIFFVNLVDKKAYYLLFPCHLITRLKICFHIAISYLYFWEWIPIHIAHLSTSPFKESFYLTKVFHVHCHTGTTSKTPRYIKWKKGKEQTNMHTFMLYMYRAHVKDIQMCNTDCSGKKARQKTFYTI